MKKYSAIIVASLLSSAVSIIFFSNYFKKQIILEKSMDNSRLVNNSDLILSGQLERYFTASQPNDFIVAANRSKNAVVAIRAIVKMENSKYAQGSYSKSNGSGVIIDEKGFIVTNLHVVENATEIEITLEDKREFSAKMVGSDPATDLALLKIESTNLPYLAFGNSDSLQIGEWVLAIGNPFKLQSSITAGIVSAKARNINILERQGVESFIQTDAAINSGNSGGALINTNGELVGINTAIMSESGKYEGFSFAVPANLARKVIFDLREFGAVQRGWMGLQVYNVNADKAEEINLGFVGGVFVEMVERNGAAKIAGIQRGDVITKINRVVTNSTSQYTEQIAAYRPGDIIHVEYIRSGKKKYTNVTLRNQLNTTDFVAVRRDPVLKKLGIELRDLDSVEKERLQTDGVYVVSVQKNSTLGQTNMDPGYIITKFNNQKIKNVNELVKQLDKNKGLTVLDGFYERYPGIFPYSFQNQ